MRMCGVPFPPGGNPWLPVRGRAREGAAKSESQRESERAAWESSTRRSSSDALCECDGLPRRCNLYVRQSAYVRQRLIVVIKVGNRNEI